MIYRCYYSNSKLSKVVAKKSKKGKREQAWTDFKTVLFKEDPGRLEKANQTNGGALFIDLFNDTRDDYLFIESRNWLEKKRVTLYAGKNKQLEKSLEIGKYVTPVARHFDINGDEINDLVLFDHGNKQEGHFSFTGSRPVVLLGSPNGKLINDTSISNAYMEILEEVREGGLAAVHGGVQVDEKVSAKWFDFGDIDNDGDIDIWVESSGGMNVNSHFLINENGSYTVSRDRIPHEILDGPLDSDFYRYHSSKFVDVNKDGYLDIVLGQQRDGDISHINQSSRIFLNNRQGFFDQYKDLPLPSFYDGFTRVKGIETLDINQDGRLDLVLAHNRQWGGGDSSAHYTGNYFQVLLQRKDGSFADETKLRIKGNQKWANGSEKNDVISTELLASDVNKDGHKDILINYNSTNVKYKAPTILINNGSGKLVPSSFSEAVSSDLEKDDVYSWSESRDGVKLWRFAPKDKGIEYSELYLDQPTPEGIGVKDSKKSNSVSTTNSDKNTLYKPSKFNKKSSDKITNFNPSTDTLEIDTNSFGLDSSVTFAVGKNMKAVKKKLANKDFDFLYDEKKGGLYFNENGADKGFGDGGIIAILKGAPDLISENLEFI